MNISSVVFFASDLICALAEAIKAICEHYIH